MSSILVPQAVRAMLPALISQCVVVLKDTSLGFIVTYVELVRAGRLIYESYFNIIPTVIVITVIYVSMNMTLSALANLVERRTRVRTGGAPVVHAPVDTGAAV
jgi:glutamate transport system permease protein